MLISNAAEKIIVSSFHDITNDNAVKIVKLLRTNILTSDNEFDIIFLEDVRELSLPFPKI